MVPGTNHPSQKQAGQNGDFTVELNRERPDYPRDGSGLSQEQVPFVPGTVPVCPGHRPAQNVYVYCFSLGRFQEFPHVQSVRVWQYEPARKWNKSSFESVPQVCSWCGILDKKNVLLWSRQPATELKKSQELEKMEIVDD